MQKIKPYFDKLKYRERVMAFMLAAVVGALSAKFFVVDELRSILATHQQSVAAAADMTRLQSTLATLDTAKQQDIKKDPLWNFRAENTGVANLIKAFSTAGSRRNDLTVRKIASEKFERGSEYDTTTFQLEVEAPFNSLGGFLEDLEKSNLLTRVESVQVNRIEKELKLCRARILLNSFNWRGL